VRAAGLGYTIAMEGREINRREEEKIFWMATKRS
jgi:hypothetical protein